MSINTAWDAEEQREAGHGDTQPEVHILIH